MQRNRKLIAGATAGALLVSGAALAGIAFAKAPPRDPGGSRIVRQRVTPIRTWPDDTPGTTPQQDFPTGG
jgi:hypothetical protein